MHSLHMTLKDTLVHTTLLHAATFLNKWGLAADIARVDLGSQPDLSYNKG